MKGEVSATGSYNGAPAFEYEIRDDAGQLLGVDIVILHPKEGESWDDLAAFVRDSFLPARARKWALSEKETDREQRRERRIGGKRLAELPMASTAAPAINGARPTRSHRVSVSVTKTQAEEWKAVAGRQPLSEGGV